MSLKMGKLVNMSTSEWHADILGQIIASLLYLAGLQTPTQHPWWLHEHLSEKYWQVLNSFHYNTDSN